jgi:4-hydroxybenzoate polyprenyltransferase
VKETIKKIGKKITDYGTLVMFSHTIFSLSFALIAMLLAAEGLPPFRVFFWIFVAFMGARTGANAINRVIDAEIDAKNARTAMRQIPQGLIEKKEVVVFTIICFLVMAFAASRLNRICFWLSPLAIFLMTFYSYTKRFTWLCHVILGVTSAAAPVGAWLAVTGKLSLLPLLMGVANTFWVAGFDIIYGAQDYDFDRANGLYSIPVRFGVAGGLQIARLFHLVTWLSLVGVGILSPNLGLGYQCGMGIIGILFILEHRMVSPDHLTHVKLASYNINQLISLVFLVCGVLSAVF